MSHTQPSSSDLSLCLFRVRGHVAAGLLGILLGAVHAHGQSLTISDPNELLATDPAAFVRLLEVARPPAISRQAKAIVLGSLPQEGEVTVLGVSAREKLAGLSDLLRAAQRDGVYEIKVVDVPQAGIAIHARAIVIISERALALLDVEELRASVAHEIGHEYVWAEYERAARRNDVKRLRQLELVCDAIAVVTLYNLGMEAAPLINGFAKMIDFNRITLGTPTNESNYPTLPQRRQFAREVEAWTAGRAALAVR